MNWVPMGLAYALLYMGRYNLTVAKSALGDDLMSKAQFGTIFAVGAWVYGFSFLVTGPLTDKMGGRAAMLLGTAGALVINALMGVMLYGAANRDEDIFGDTAEVLDITRSPNVHIAFGAGEHSCLGAQLARLEAQVMWEVLLGTYPSIELTGEVTRLRDTMVPGVKKMPVRLGANA